MSRPHYIVDEPWSKVPVSLVDAPNMTLSALRLYLLLDEKVGKRGWWYGGQQELADELGVSVRTVRDCTETLNGYVAVERLGAEHGTRLKYLVLARTLVVEAESDRQDSAARTISDRHPTAAPTGKTLPVLPIPLTEELTDQITQIRARDALVRAWEGYGVSLTMGPRVSDDIAVFAAFLTEEDVAEAVRRTSEGDTPGWPLCRAILNTAAAARRDGRDPWASRARSNVSPPKSYSTFEEALAASTARKMQTRA